MQLANNPTCGKCRPEQTVAAYMLGPKLTPSPTIAIGGGVQERMIEQFEFSPTRAFSVLAFPRNKVFDHKMVIDDNLVLI